MASVWAWPDHPAIVADLAAPAGVIVRIGGPGSGTFRDLRGDVVEEAQRGGGGRPAPRQQYGVEAIDLGSLGFDGLGDRIQDGSLPREQVGRIQAGPVQEGQLDQQVRPDVPHVLHRRTQPVLDFLAALCGHGVDGPLWAEARLD